MQRNSSTSWSSPCSATPTPIPAPEAYSALVPTPALFYEFAMGVRAVEVPVFLESSFLRCGGCLTVVEVYCLPLFGIGGNTS